VTQALKAVLDYVAPLPPASDKDHLTRQFIRNTATEAAVVAFFTGLSCYFAVSNTLRIEFLKKAVTVSAVNFLARAVATTCRYAAIVDRGLFFRTVSLAVDCIAPFYFAKEFHFPHFIIHESGHFLSSYLLYKKVDAIQIVAKSMQSWVTNSHSTGFSKAGDYLGLHYSRMTFMAAGTAATILSSQIALIFALHLKNEYGELSKFLFFSGCFFLVKEFNYAKMALNTSNDGVSSQAHDFIILWQEGGLHPRAAMAAVIALPVISTLSYLLVRHRGQIF